MKISIPFAMIIALLAVGCRSLDTGSPESVLAMPAAPQPPVSLIRIISNPDQFSGQELWVVGFLRIKDGDALLFVREEDARQCLLVNAIRARLPTGMTDRSDEFTWRYVVLKGVFVAALDHVTGQTVGVLRDVSRCMTEGIGPTVTYPESHLSPGVAPFEPETIP